MQNNFIPYIGPRYFEQEDKHLFFGRDYETRELCSRIIAHNVVLFYAQSGAGKTSLINAGVIPRMQSEEFEILPVARVSGQIPRELNPSNIYMFNALLNWSSNDVQPETLASITMRDFIKERMKKNTGDTPLLIIFDQFEELFTHYQERWTERKNFFEQVVETLEGNPLLRVVFVMREDFIAYLDPYIPLFPNKLNVRFRLERMKREPAIAAIVGPVQQTEKKYADGVAEYIVDELVKVKVNTATGDTIVIPGEYIEPVQLQVVCQNLWSHLPDGVNVITKEHVQKVGSVDDALREFYDDAVSSITGNEKTVRTWFETQLITSTGTRGTVFRGPKDTGGIKNDVIDELQKKYVIRGEWRAGGQWYELTHDSLIKAVQDSNKVFNEKVKTSAEQFYQRGLTNITLKEYKKAIAEFDKAIRLDNQFKLAYENKSYALSETGAHQESLEAINEALRIDPLDAWAYSQRGKVYNDLKEYKKALIELDKAIELGFNETWTYANKSYALNEMGQNQKALEAINEALEIDPNYTWAYGRRGKIYNDIGEYEKALPDLEKAIEMDSTDKWSLGNKAYALNEMGKSKNALDVVNKAIELDPSYSWAYGYRGKIFNDLKEYEKAISDMDKAIELGSDENWVYGNKAYSFNQIGKNDKALEAINKTLELFPDYGWAYSQRGKIYCDLGEYEKALIDLDRALEIGFTETWTYVNMAFALNETGQNVEALQTVNKVIELDPDYAYAYSLRGKIYIEMKDYKKALIDLDKAISLDYNMDWTHANRSLALNELGENEKALDAINKCLKINPEYGWAYGQRGKIYIDMKQYKKAVSDLDIAIKLGCKEKWIYGNKAFALFEMGQVEKASAEINRAIEIDPEYQWGLNLRADINERLTKKH